MKENKSRRWNVAAVLPILILAFPVFTVFLAGAQSGTGGGFNCAREVSDVMALNVEIVATYRRWPGACKREGIVSFLFGRIYKPWRWYACTADGADLQLAGGPWEIHELKGLGVRWAQPAERELMKRLIEARDAKQSLVKYACASPATN